MIRLLQLCLALADLALQMPTWQKPVLDLISRFNVSNKFPLLEVLTVLPEEVNSRTLKVGANRRHQVLQELTACVPTFTSFLVSAIPSHFCSILADCYVLIIDSFFYLFSSCQFQSTILLKPYL